MVDAPADGGEVERDAFTVNASKPVQLSDRVVFVRPFSLQEGFGLTVAELLFPVFSDRFAPVMPDHCCWREAYDASSVPEPPAKVYVISSCSEDGIKSVNCFQCFSSESHVAAWQVLCDPV